MLNSKLRKRRAPTASLLPQYHKSDAPSNDVATGKRYRTKKKSWQQTSKLALVCLSVTILAAVGVWRFVSTPFQAETISPHASFLHRMRGKAGFRQWAKHIKKRHGFNKRIFKEMTCPDGSKGYIDDDYCDCADGSDEPNTSACSYILIQRASFHCKDGSDMIYPSRVGDGIKDCADGSDEA
jgi:hypothetical protein